MGDETLLNCDTFFCGGAQVTDTTGHMHAWEYDITASAHLFNSSSTDKSIQQTQSIPYPLVSPSCQQQHKQSSVRGASLSSEILDKSGQSNTSGRRATNSGTTVNISSIPFVQIHTTDMNPQRSSFGNVFRRNTTSQDVIKSEPIKSENTDTGKERINGTPTPPVRETCCNNDDIPITSPNADVRNSGKIPRSSSRDTVDTMRPQPGVSELAESIPAVHKCRHCPFISLTQVDILTHESLAHMNEVCHTREELRMRIPCPGCKNTFYTCNSLETHLREDHLMATEDCKKLMVAVRDTYATPFYRNIATQSEINTEKVTAEPPNKHPAKKSRIYLKNFECLRKPFREPIEQLDSQIADKFGEMCSFESASSAVLNNVGSDDFVNNTIVSVVENNELTNSSNNKLMCPPRKQTISIKSVDVLREPELMRRDYEIQNFNSFMNSSHDIDIMGVSNSEQFSYGSPNDSDMGKSNMSEKRNVLDKPRRPKIYIKDVDILKEPTVLSSNLDSVGMQQNSGAMTFNFMPQGMAQGGGNYLNGVDNLALPLHVFDANLASLPMGALSDQYIFENVNKNFMSNINEPDELSFMTSQSPNNFLLDNTRFSNGQNCSLDTTHVSTTPTMTEPTPPPPIGLATPVTINESNSLDQRPHPTHKQPKQKIFIKDVDILKAPQFQEHRGTLHLRTVDELNLMNKNEVENLITPNLDVSSNNCTFSESANFSEEVFSDVDNFKLQDFVSHIPNNWTDDYDLTDDLDCIVTDIPTRSHAFQNTIYDKSHTSVITLRGIEDLTGRQMNNAYQGNEVMPSIGVAQPEHSASHSDNIYTARNISSDSQQNNHGSGSGGINHKSGNVAFTDNQRNLIGSATSAPNFVNPPPLVPVSNIADDWLSTISSAPPSATAISASVSDIPVPPLVPVSSRIPRNVSAINLGCTVTGLTTVPTTTTVTAIPATVPAEKSRIYVANNLLKRPNETTSTLKSCTTNTASPAFTATSVRGRPYGSNHAASVAATQSQNLSCNAGSVEVEIRCNVRGCTFRFKKAETLAVHKSCHVPDSTQAIVCFKCKSTNFTNWNSLHTHLWRTHKVDMELYSCDVCDFKTPVYSRLINTHMKIHCDDRNFKCTECEKAFKNTKQLKNHRRWHRYHATSARTAKDTTQLHRCSECGAAFTHSKSLREHMCNYTNPSLQCSVCGRTLGSKSSLRLHKRTHDVVKRFKCDTCEYTASDHNAFRRHKMTHKKSKMYACHHCDYTSIQSIAYQRHVQQKHPEEATGIVYKCPLCPFSTINRSLLTVHLAKHETTTITTSQQGSGVRAASDQLSAPLCLESTSANNKSALKPFKPREGLV